MCTQAAERDLVAGELMSSMAQAAAAAAPAMLKFVLLDGGIEGGASRPATVGTWGCLAAAAVGPLLALLHFEDITAVSCPVFATRAPGPAPLVVQLPCRR